MSKVEIFACSTDGSRTEAVTASMTIMDASETATVTDATSSVSTVTTASLGGQLYAGQNGTYPSYSLTASPSVSTGAMISTEYSENKTGKHALSGLSISDPCSAGYSFHYRDNRISVRHHRVCQ